MVALNTAYAPNRTLERSQNRVGDFFCEGADCVGNNRLVSRIAAEEKSGYTYETASGRPFWPNRDPIGELGWMKATLLNQAIVVDSESFTIKLWEMVFAKSNSPDIYLMLSNDTLNKTDYLGLACGSGITAGIVPDRPGGFDFTSCCGSHDACYGRCGSKKSSCDDSFFNCMINKCINSYSGQLGCSGLAQVYYGAVVQYGDGPFKRAQRSATPQDYKGTGCPCYGPDRKGKKQTKGKEKGCDCPE